MFKLLFALMLLTTLSWSESQTKVPNGGDCGKQEKCTAGDLRKLVRNPSSPPPALPRN